MTPTSELDRLADLLLSLLIIDTGPGREDAVVPTLRAHLDRVGLSTSVQPVDPGRSNILATAGRPRVLFTTHLDTVAPHLPARRVGNRVFGRGACDAKGQIVCQLEAMGRLLTAGYSNLAWLGVVGEETDAAGARAAAERADRLQDVELVLGGEPTGLAAATGQRGYLHLELTCHGRAAHSGTPERGHCAVVELLDWIERIRRVPSRPEDPRLGLEVWNVGRIHGGVAANVVAPRAQAEIVCRFLPGSDFEAQVRGVAPAGAEVVTRVREEPAYFSEVPDLPSTRIPFGSDLPTIRSFFPSAEAVLLGPGAIELAHSDQESLELTDLARGIDCLTTLARRQLDREMIRGEA